jgi:hypothetical protein
MLMFPAKGGPVAGLRTLGTLPLYLQNGWNEYFSYEKSAMDFFGFYVNLSPPCWQKFT